MFVIDQYAYSNRLKHVNPVEKLAFSTLTMIVVLESHSPAVPLLGVMVMAFASILMAGIPWRYYLKLLILPLGFLFAAVLGVALSITKSPIPSGFGVGMWGVTIGATPQSIHQAMLTGSRSMGAISSLYFLTLTTPLTDLVAVLRKMRVPTLLIELMIIIYRFIFVLMDTGSRIYTSQASRNGYARTRNAYFSLGQLTANLFLKSIQRSKMAFAALESRAYTGELLVLDPEYPLSGAHLVLIVAIELALLSANWLLVNWR